jgi:hypothetical protein
VRLNVALGRVFSVFGGMNVVPMRQVCMVGSLFMVSRFVMRGGFMVMARSVFVMLGCLLVMMNCFVRHVQPPDDLKTRLLQPRGIIGRRWQSCG